jgi:hypothetical protein
MACAGPDSNGYPNQQVYRYRSQAGDADVFARPDSVQVLDFPNDTNSGVNFNSWFARTRFRRESSD